VGSIPTRSTTFAYGRIEMKKSKLSLWKTYDEYNGVLYVVAKDIDSALKKVRAVLKANIKFDEENHGTIKFDEENHGTEYEITHVERLAYSDRFFQ
jgi:hypothetical protein